MGDMRLFIAGDVHGNTRWVCEYLIPTAVQLGADVIVQCGDFGYWEHEQAGVDYLDEVDLAAQKAEVQLRWLHGNHDKWSLIADRYHRSPDGLYRIRPSIEYAPNGHIWTWVGYRMRVFGGAYSVDKQYRLDIEAKRRVRVMTKNAWRRGAGHPEVAVPDTAATMWFPEEQMTDQDMQQLLDVDSSRLDIVFSHDKPRRSEPGLVLKDLPECMPNQDRLQRALDVHQPGLWFHGHLHHRYSHTVWQDNGRATHVVGLAADDWARGRFWKPADAWCLVDLEEGRQPVVTSGEVAHEWVTAA